MTLGHPRTVPNRSRQVAEAVAGDTDRLKEILYEAVEEFSPAEKELYKNFGGVRGIVLK